MGTLFLYKTCKILTRGKNNPWPEYARVLKIDYGQEEYIEKFGHDPRRYLTSVKEFYGDENGNVKTRSESDFTTIQKSTTTVTRSSGSGGGSSHSSSSSSGWNAFRLCN